MVSRITKWPRSRDEGRQPVCAEHEEQAAGEGNQRGVALQAGDFGEARRLGGQGLAGDASPFGPLVVVASSGGTDLGNMQTTAERVAVTRAGLLRADRLITGFYDDRYATVRYS